MKQIAAFFVPGIPRPGGSKTAFRHSKTGRIIVKDSGTHTKEWRATVAQVANDAYSGPVLDCAISVHFAFIFQRPRSHYKTGKRSYELKDGISDKHTTKPDTTKLIRSTEDALTGIIWRDDSRIFHQSAEKIYGDRSGAWIFVDAYENE